MAQEGCGPVAPEEGAGHREGRVVGPVAVVVPASGRVENPPKGAPARGAVATAIPAHVVAAEVARLDEVEGPAP